MKIDFETKGGIRQSFLFHQFSGEPDENVFVIQKYSNEYHYEILKIVDEYEKVKQFLKEYVGIHRKHRKKQPTLQKYTLFDEAARDGLEQEDVYGIRVAEWEVE